MATPPITVLRDPTLVEVREAHFARLESLFAGEDLDEVFILCGIGVVTEEAGPDWEVWLDKALEFLAKRAKWALDRRVFRPLTLTYNPRGVHFVDYLFGAEVFRMEDGSWQTHTLTTPVGTLQRPDLEANEAWQAARALTWAFLERDVPGVLFGLPTLASALNIAVNLYGQEIILAMLIEPEAVRHDLRVINDVLCELHRWYLRTLPSRQLQPIVPEWRCQPPGYGQLCGCTTQLLSPGLYEEFIAPLDAELLSVYPKGGMIHLCGAHIQHIPCWRGLPCFRAFQTNDRASEDVETYFRELREDQILYVNPCEAVPVERILAATGGRRLVIPADLPHLPAVPRR
ncbi:MAG: hypothetical protein ACUVX8_08530 [Candidatus Zipacnadales bacterium]